MAPVSVLLLQTWCELCKGLSSHPHLMEDGVTMQLLLSHLLADYYEVVNTTRTSQIKTILLVRAKCVRPEKQLWKATILVINLFLAAPPLL